MLIFLLLFFFTLSILFLSIFIFPLYSKKFDSPKSIILNLNQGQSRQVFISKNNENNDKNVIAQLDNHQQGNGSRPTQLTRTILLEELPPDSPKWAEPFKGTSPDKNGPNIDGGRIGDEDEDAEKRKKRKKRAKKKRPDPDSGGGAGEEEREKDDKKEELVCLYPFTTSSSAVQRKIKKQYDQLVKSHEANGLTLDQVGQFVNCLVESKKDLQHRSEVIQRKFTITKALLLKADRSSFDRLRQQIFKLELEQKRLEEDAFVYNWLQRQLKLSPAYKKMLEISACMEMQDKPHEQVESRDNEFADISFEELLAQEKKDAFWKRNGKTRLCSV